MIKRILLLFATAIFSCGLLVAQPTVKQSINSNWEFHKGDLPGLPEHGPDTAAWEKISIPHSWNVSDVVDDRPGYYRGIGWYKKTIYVPTSWKEKNIYLYFEGANQVAEVYINGKLAGKHIGGYTAFSFPIGNLLNYDADGLKANQIVVKLDNSFSDAIPPISADFTFFGGIYRDVYLLAANPVHFNLDSSASSGIRIKTPQVSASQGSLTVEGQISNNSDVRKSIKVISSVYSAGGNLIRSAKTDLKISPNRTVGFSMLMEPVKKPHLWSPDDPYLYRVMNNIYDDKGNLVDQNSAPLGFRWFNFDAATGFHLNGKAIKLMGANRHQDYEGMANAVPDAIHERDMQLLKDMGANFIRISHYPQDPAVLEACDRLGLLASMEIPVVNRITQSAEFTENCKNMQLEMIRQNFNHPSIIIWAYMNEVLLVPRYDQNTPERHQYYVDVAKLASTLDSLTRKEDPSRYTMISCHGDFDPYFKSGITKIPQIVGWNLYYGWYGGGFEGFGKFLDRHRRDIPDKPMIVTEYGCDGDTRLHNFSPERFDKTIEYETIYHKKYFKEIIDRPFVAGGAMWCLVDFNSEGRIDAAPHINTKGVATDTRIPKDVYYYYQANLLKKPYIKIGSRNWTLRTGIANEHAECTQPVEVYSNLPQVSLWLNEKLLGTQTVKDKVALFNVPFKNGINDLKAADNVLMNHEDFAEIRFQLQPAILKDLKIPFKELNVSLGDSRYIIDDKLQQVWFPEQAYIFGSWGYIGGSVFKMKGSTLQNQGTNKNILGTEYDPIYATQRVGLSEFKLDVPDGKYEVTLLFAELLSATEQNTLPNDLSNNAKNDEVSGRKFDVLINGQKVLENLGGDNYLEPLRSLSFKYTINVVDLKGINIEFKSVKGESILNGLQVKRIF